MTLTDSKSKRLRAGLTTTQTQTRTETLTGEEERVVRMLHGLSEPDEAELPFEKSKDPEVNARLRLIEAALLAEMHGMGPLAQDEDDDQDSPKAKILRRLREIDED